MSRTALAEVSRPTFQVSFKEFVETPQEYPVELVKDGYYALVWGKEEHYKQLKAGWSDEREDGVMYKPMSAHPDTVTKAKQLLPLELARVENRRKERIKKEEAIRTGGRIVEETISRKDVDRMIEEALKQRLG